MIWAKAESTNYLTTFTNGEQVAQSDTTPDKGGGGLGFRPHELLEAALASCLNMTLRMAAEERAIPLTGTVVTVSLNRGLPGGQPPTFEYQVELQGEITEAQREQLLAALEECAVRNTLSQALHFRLTECHVLQAKETGDYLEALKAQVREAFAETPPPDPCSLRGSSEGDEPFLLEEEFRDVPDWRLVDTFFLDQAPDGFGSALSFFSSEALRYYLPAYLLADLDGALRQADPLFHLWCGLDDERRDEPVNERRYGGWTWLEAVSERFSGFSAGEIEAIVAYLRYKAEEDELNRPKIEQALRNYWLA